MSIQPNRNAFRATKFALGLGGALLLSGCLSTGLEDMSANVAQSVSTGGGLWSHGAGSPALSVPIFIASTRKNDRSTELTSGANAHYALTFVSVPPGHEAGTIEAPSFGRADPEKHFVVTGRRNLDEDAFRAELAAHVSGRVGVNRDILLYVHGFNTSLEQARFRLAQVVADGRFGGVPVLFTWPSKSALFAYGADKESASASRDAYLKLLHDLADTPGVGRIHILAHSMGTWLTMEALREAALSGSPDLNGRLGDVMLAAPDIDLSVFRQQIARLDPSHFSVFVSKSDRALQISASLQGDRRLGAIDPGEAKDRDMIEQFGVKVFDISDLSTGLIGHNSYANVPNVVRSIGAQLAEPRKSDGHVQAVIDAGADRSAPTIVAPTSTTPAANPALTSPTPASPTSASPVAPLADAQASAATPR